MNTLDCNELTQVQYRALLGHVGTDTNFLRAVSIFNALHSDLPPIKTVSRIRGGRVISHMIYGNQLPPHAVEWLFLKGATDVLEIAA